SSESEDELTDQPAQTNKDDLPEEEKSLAKTGNQTGADQKKTANNTGSSENSKDLQNPPRKRSREEASTDLKTLFSDEPKPKAAKKLDSSSGAEQKADQNNHKPHKDKEKVHASKTKSPNKKSTQLIDDLFGGESPKVAAKSLTNNSLTTPESKAVSKETEKPTEKVVKEDKKSVEKRSSDSSSSRSNGNNSEVSKIQTSSSSASKGKTIGKSEMADIVVGFLMPYFKRGKIESKDKFKFMARDFSHQAIKRGLKTKHEVESFVKSRFAKSKEEGTTVVAAATSSTK
ncbi:ATP-dependent DNA helicase Q5, partial [Orchesella cincta]